VVEIPPEVWVTGPPQRKARGQAHDHEGGHDPGGVGPAGRPGASDPCATVGTAPQDDGHLEAQAMAKGAMKT